MSGRQKVDKRKGGGGNCNN